MSALVCPACKGALDCWRCARCEIEWPVANDIADFSGGAYYDRFDEATQLTDAHRDGLLLEMDGTRRRILDFYLPQVRRVAPPDARILDCGCGNGLSVDLLIGAGFDAWGNDVSMLRKWQWREREHRDRLVVASGLSLPFPDRYFDVIVSSGVIEHIGVEETSLPQYRVTPLPNRDALRAAFVRELLRVLEPGGSLFLDCPNGRFPIDFWHSDAPGRPRVHSPREGFLPSYREIAALVPGARIEALSPHRRLQFQQAARHWYGRAFALPMSLFFRLMTVRGFRLLARTALNPFLVVRVTSASRDR